MRAVADVGVDERLVDRHCDPRGAPRPQSYPLLGPRPAARGIPHARCSASSRSTPTSGSRRSSSFDLDDIDAAFEELDARYLAGEAAAHAHTWSVIAGVYAALNRHELPATTPDWVEHRPPARDQRSRPVTWPHTSVPRGTSRQTSRIYIEAVHRLSDLGAVFTHAAHGTSQEGFDAEWREIATSDGRRRPDQPLRDLRRGRPRRRARAVRRAQPPAPRLENAASRVFERFRAYFAARDWDAMAEILADDISNDDRRRVVNAGIRHGRDADDREHAGDRRPRGQRT